MRNYGRSFKYNANNNGDKLSPRLTLISQLTNAPILVLNLTADLAEIYKDLLNTLPLISYDNNFDQRCTLATESIAFL